MRKNDKIVEVELEMLASSDRAVLVINIKNEEVWIPKSQIIVLNDSDDLDDFEEGDTIDVEIPEWLAKTKELI